MFQNIPEASEHTTKWIYSVEYRLLLRILKCEKKTNSTVGQAHYAFSFISRKYYSFEK